MQQAQDRLAGWSGTVTSGARGAGAPLDVSAPAPATADKGHGRFRKITDVPLEGIPVYDLADVLRMDVTTGWVYSRWSRKSTALADVDLFGVRVPLMTGTKVDDLAGSLTYYFNTAGRVQRISFRGRTGDTRKLVNLLIARYGFRQQLPQVAGEQLYQVRWNGKPISELRIRPAAVLWASTPHASFQVELELERPGSGRFLSGRPPALTQTRSSVMPGVGRSGSHGVPDSVMLGQA
ncbi:MAG: hypothetical protein A2W31_15780 [Planctomycetes bacterium RBG_16_64_10]|nr:MAG: hypothetical protein A2W31_15780 [Planctomycetes bacterium RBG_16_64_10]